MALPKYADAVIFPTGRMQTMSMSQRVNAIDKILTPVFGCMHCHTGNQGPFNLATPLILTDGRRAPEVSLLFPNGHPLEKRERLTWYVAVQDKKTKLWAVDETKPLRGYLSEPDAIKFGYLKPDPLADGQDEDLEFNPADFAASTTAAPEPIAEPVAEPVPAIAAKALPPLADPSAF